METMDTCDAETIEDCKSWQIQTNQTNSIAIEEISLRVECGN